MIFSLLKTNNYSYSRKLTNKFTPNKKQQKIMDIALLQPWRCIFTNIHNTTAPQGVQTKRRLGKKHKKPPFHRKKWRFFINSGSQDIPWGTFPQFSGNSCMP